MIFGTVWLLGLGFGDTSIRGTTSWPQSASSGGGSRKTKKIAPPLHFNKIKIWTNNDTLPFLRKNRENQRYSRKYTGTPRLIDAIFGILIRFTSRETYKRIKRIKISLQKSGLSDLSYNFKIQTSLYKLI